MPRVTVIIPTYNWSTVLPYSIGSVLGQSFTDFELLVIGDGCTDDSETVVRSIGDPRVHWINIARTGHQSGPNNEGLDRAQGDIVAYLGHDDLWFPHHLEQHVRTLDAQADFTISLTAAIGPQASFIECSPPDVVRGRWLFPSASAHRRETVKAVGGWRDYRTLTVTPEENLVARVIRSGARFEVVPRLTALKFPASLRRNVYRERPMDEQAAWLKRIRTEPDLEAMLLARIFATPTRQIDGTPQRLWRLARRPSQWWSFIWRRSGSRIRATKRFKGVE